MPWPRTYARLRPGINHVLAYGQSLSTGWEGWPALSTSPIQGALMLGASVRPASESAALWEPVGAPEFHPLVATVQELTSDRLLSRAETAALAPGTLALGETVLEGAIAEWLSPGTVNPQARFLASACGVGGRALEALCKGATPDLFNRLRSCVRIARDVAGAGTGGLGYGIVALLFLQGENNSWGLGGTADLNEYKALLTRFYADFLADVAAATAGQALPPAMFMYQTGGAYASRDNAIAQAQLELALEIPLCFLAAPVYPVTDKGGHLDANGYRWLGAQFGKVMRSVLTRGEPWLPLHPLRAIGVGAMVHVTFHVPVRPLVWGRPFAGLTRVDPKHQGFCACDAAGDIAIMDVALDGADSVRIELARQPGQGAMLLYASAATGGVGGLHDSDPARSVQRYTLEKARSGDVTPDILSLAGQHYPLHNWCVAFSVAISV